MDILPGEEIVWSGHPTWRATLSAILKGIGVGLALLVVCVAIDTLGASSDWTRYGLVAFVVVAAGAVGWSWFTRRFTVYTITSRRLHMRAGMFTKTETSTTIDRVQNVTVRQTLVDRMLKTGTIDFDTASDDPSDTFRFVGIDNPQALRERLAHAQHAGAETSAGV